MKLGHIQINVRKYADGRWGFDDYSRGYRKRIRLWEKAKANDRASDYGVFLHNGRKALQDASANEIAEFRAWKDRKSRDPMFAVVVSEFMATKREDKNLDPGYVSNLEHYLSNFVDELGATRISEIDPDTIRRILSGLNRKARSRNNTRDVLCAVFRFARERGIPPATQCTSAFVRDLPNDGHQ